MPSLLFEFSHQLDKRQFRKKNSRGCILAQPRHSGSNSHHLAVQWVEMVHIQITVNYTNVCCTNRCLICAMFFAFTVLHFLVLCQKTNHQNILCWWRAETSIQCIQTFCLPDQFQIDSAGLGNSVLGPTKANIPE